MEPTNVYRIAYDGMTWIVLAPDFSRAIEAWRVEVALRWGSEWRATDQPESVERLDGCLVTWGPDQPTPEEAQAIGIKKEGGEA